MFHIHIFFIILINLMTYRDIWKMWTNTKEFVQGREEDVHSRLMKRNYESVPQWWFLVLLVTVFGLSLFTCLGFDKQLQLPWWGVLLASTTSFVFTLPDGVIVATTNTVIILLYIQLSL
ncbi:Oligopeptide transporter 1 [Platanthera zijinensis]|uniref:Oligopeptide transporter 1 n=1 Tax=Platanthera zijinensis TaxID=2320716 RepID=A0AAP0AVS6_9ASPA